MKKGIWLDKKEAYIYDEKGRLESHLDSEAELRIRYIGENPQRTRFGGQFIDDEKRLEHRVEQQLQRYYDHVLEEVEGCKEVIIIGPGLTKKHLKARLNEKSAFKNTLVSLFTSDNVTDNQRAEMVREYYQDTLVRPR